MRDAPETVDDVVLAVSELLTNAHVHAHSTAHLVLSWDRRCLHVYVSDTGPGLPTPRDHDTTRVSGRGLAIVDAVADEWETLTHAGGKAIYACFRPPGQTDPHAAS
ncbi:ATP-binding protein [Embleya scabrispora]|nr:ATP-binding protein [Embleya scabrispora]